MLSEGFAIIYDLQDAHAWRQAHAHRSLWGRRFCQHYVLDEDHLLIVFIPGGTRWASWEARRERWILGHLEGRAT
jgi:hypothetical protein